MEKFGQYLLRHEVISQEQLNEALQCQVIFGGRLGTNLVELGYLGLDDLGRYLSRRSGFPTASVEELEDLPKETLGAIPRALVEKFKIIPIRIEAKTLHLAVCDPTELKTIDEISFSTGMRVKPYLLPELRMYYLLEKHYGVKREIRYIRLGRTLSRGKYAGAMMGATAGGGPATIVDPSPSAMPAPSQPNAQELEAKGFRALKPGEELTSEESHAEATLTPPAGVPAARPTLSVVEPAPVMGTVEEPAMPLLDEMHLEPIEEAPPIPAPADRPVPYPPPTSVSEAAELRQYLQNAPDREEVAIAALRLARTHFATVAMFIVNKGMILGWRGAGNALDRQSIEPLMLPANADSIFKEPAAGSVVFHGPIPKGGLNERLLAGLGRELPMTAVVLPVSLKNRVVNLVYADNGGTGVSAAAAGYLQLLTRDIATAYERIILAKKKNTAETGSRG